MPEPEPDPELSFLTTPPLAELLPEINPDAETEFKLPKSELADGTVTTEAASACMSRSPYIGSRWLKLLFPLAFPMPIPPPLLLPLLKPEYSFGVVELECLRLLIAFSGAVDVAMGSCSERRWRCRC